MVLRMAITRILGITGMGTINGDVVEAVVGSISSQIGSGICLRESTIHAGLGLTAGRYACGLPRVPSRSL